MERPDHAGESLANVTSGDTEGEVEILKAPALQEEINKASFNQAVQRGETHVAAFFAGGELAKARVERVGAHGSCKEESLRTVRGQQDSIMQLYAH